MSDMIRCPKCERWRKPDKCWKCGHEFEQATAIEPLSFSPEEMNYVKSYNEMREAILRNQACQNHGPEFECWNCARP